jgi:hypothetical protein
MLHFFKTKQMHADYSTSAMETDTISKNGRKSKSHTSRGKFLRIACFGLLAAGIIFSGCKKDKDKNGNGEEVYLVTEISVVNEYGDSGMMFEYDNQNRITKIIYNERDYTYTQTLNYNSAGDLYQSIDDDGYIVTITRNGNIITIVESDSYGEYSKTFELNAQGLFEKLTLESSYEDGSWYKRVNICQYQGRNLIKTTYEEENYWHGEFEKYSGVNTLTYDNKMSPIYHCKTPGWFLIYYFVEYGIHNNVKTEDYNGDRVVTNEYTYNDAGFPISRNVIVDGEREYTEIFKYGTEESNREKSALCAAPNQSNVDHRDMSRENRRSLMHRFWGSSAKN